MVVIERVSVRVSLRECEALPGELAGPARGNRRGRSRMRRGRLS